MTKDIRICIVGLGYVGLPVALAFATKFSNTVGFDISEQRIKELKQGIDRTGEYTAAEVHATKLMVTSDVNDIRDCNFYIVAVPTPVDSANIPNLTPVIKASETVGKVLKKGDIVVYESTVYPGVTEDICAPILQRFSGLRSLEDFKLGYSPERINPGDKERTVTKITKIVAGQDHESLVKIAAVYGAIIEAGVYQASSIKVAEAAKVIENTQRDLNIALVNELALIFDRLGISTKEVLEAAGTKWNFLKFKPGLVGGHCIGVDPYYLTYKAEELGYHPHVINAGRRINDSMAGFVAQKTVKLMLKQNIDILTAKVGILGLSFKENVPDIRNSKIPDIVRELKEFGINVQVCDPLADASETMHEYGIELTSESNFKDLDVLIFAVPHDVLMQENASRVVSKVNANGIVMDVKAVLDRANLPEKVTYWSL